MMLKGAAGGAVDRDLVSVQSESMGGWEGRMAWELRLDFVLRPGAPPKDC